MARSKHIRLGSKYPGYELFLEYDDVGDEGWVWDVWLTLGGGYEGVLLSSGYGNRSAAITAAQKVLLRAVSLLEKEVDA